jgi:hypothetical protein
MPKYVEGDILQLKTDPTVKKRVVYVSEPDVYYVKSSECEPPFPMEKDALDRYYDTIQRTNKRGAP